MTREEFDKRYKDHPLGNVFTACEKTNSWKELHTYYITAKATIHLLRYQGELTQPEEDSLIEMLHQITDGKLGNAETKH